MVIISLQNGSFDGGVNKSDILWDRLIIRLSIDIDPCYGHSCKNHGKCISANNGEAKCVCPSGHVGRFCEKPVFNGIRLKHIY